MSGYVSDFSPTVQSYYGELHRFNSLDRNVEDKLIILAKNGDGTLASIQVVDPGTGYKVYKSISSDEYKNFYYECF